MEIKIDVTNIKIETPRLILRPWHEADLENFYAYASVPGVGEMAGWPHHKSINESRKILEIFMKDKNVLAIIHKEDKKVIGSLGLHASWASEDERFRHLKSWEIGYVVAKDYWGQGIAAEAAGAVIDYAFTKLGVEALTCGHFKDNVQSRRVIEKCGFQFVEEGTFFSKQLDREFEDMKYILLSQQISR